MKRKLINSQLSNYRTYLMYKIQLLNLAENVYTFKNMPQFIDIGYVNKELVRKGSIAFFFDEIMGLLALPYVNLGNKLDIYNRPTKIQVIGSNGYTKFLDVHEFVIMYDNNAKIPLYYDILQYAERIALDTRTRRYKYATTENT